MNVQPINWHSFFFLLFALVACAFAVAVVLSSNIVRMAFYLVLSLGATAGLFFLAGADFVGAMQLMIYVGGTLVLLVFGVMLTAQGPFVSMKTARRRMDSGGVRRRIAAGGVAAGGVQHCDRNRRRRSSSRQQAAADGEVASASVATAHGDASRIGLGLLGMRVDQA